ncbi:hypothetical protein PM10SUCC1_35440 [Propionigenium maris DSM 9537]|uniref:Nudix hydrolase domain-containing protein n=1 Tax=Propionigenium maris DSM 9537 TaxID=1123000 RepID=A0A9W6GPJ3_9FUSO|nr:NUDIX domain-containing protein [Propionigenium maris]GLI58030.1 hypothetical protein PM10SUCC1_35440 [Propionigenium maris DSM 9537]
MDIKLHRICERNRKYAVIIASEEGELLLVRHADRSTWEVPGGHHEEGETILETAERELYEETGALEYKLKHLCDYSVGIGSEVNFGGLFRAEITKRGPLPASEITEVQRFSELPPIEEMTYGRIQHQLMKLIEEEKEWIAEK